MMLPAKTRTTTAKARPAGFTLVEILVALGLMAVVVPVISQGLKLASLAGEVSQRKAIAMRIAERVLNETIITGQWNQVGQARDEQYGGNSVKYHWVIRNEPWSALNSNVNDGNPGGVNVSVVNGSTLHLLTVDVTFPAQGQTFAVHLSTVVDITKQVPANTPPAT
jgi:prepilin-type N-terminal cleavage/methylation domain-containing protein